MIWIRIAAPLATGFCGCLTSFSSWQLDLTNKWFSNQVSQIKYNFDLWLVKKAGSGIALFYFELSSFLCAFLFGKTLISFCKSRSATSHVPLSYQLFLILIIGIVLTCGAIIGFAVVEDYGSLFAILFTPIGALIRFYFSRLNNWRSKFPLGTFIVNVTGSALIEVFYGIETYRTPTSAAQMGALVGAQTGFCGSLTTVSTLANELMNNKNPAEWRIFYFLISVFVSQLFVVPIRLAFIYSK